MNDMRSLFLRCQAGLFFHPVGVIIRFQPAKLLAIFPVLRTHTNEVQRDKAVINDKADNSLGRQLKERVAGKIYQDAAYRHDKRNMCRALLLMCDKEVIEV